MPTRCGLRMVQATGNATNEQLEAFVYSIAHDLRSPLRSMIGYSQVLVDDYAGGLEEAARKLLKHIQSSGEFMDKLLLDLLSYGRTARSKITSGPVEVRKALRALSMRHSNRASSRRHRVH